VAGGSAADLPTQALLSRLYPQESFIASAHSQTVGCQPDTPPDWQASDGLLTSSALHCRTDYFLAILTAPEPQVSR
jgi:hypothetical protein